MYIWTKHIKSPKNVPIEHQQVADNTGIVMTIWAAGVFTLSVAGTGLVIFAIIYALRRLLIKGYIKWKSIYGLKKRMNLHKNL